MCTDRLGSSADYGGEVTVRRPASCRYRGKKGVQAGPVEQLRGRGDLTRSRREISAIRQMPPRRSSRRLFDAHMSKNQLDNRSWPGTLSGGRPLEWFSATVEPTGLTSQWIIGDPLFDRSANRLVHANRLQCEGGAVFNLPDRISLTTELPSRFRRWRSVAARASARSGDTVNSSASGTG
jgi:hypothetical protein